MSEERAGGGVLLRGRYWSDDVSIVAAAADHQLGPKGLFVASDATVSEGALLRFELAVGDEPPITGRVRVVDPAVGATGGRRRGVRLKFVQLDDPDGARALLARVDVPASRSVPPPAAAPADAASATDEAAAEAAAGEVTPPSSVPPSSVPPSSAPRESEPPTSAAPPSEPPASEPPASSGSPSASPAGRKKKRKRKKGRGEGSPTPRPSTAEVAPEATPPSGAAATDGGATSQRWEAAMALDDAFFDEAPRSSRSFVDDEPTADSAMLRASDPVYRARRKKLERTVAVVLAGATILFVAVLLRSGDARDQPTVPAAIAAPTAVPADGAASAAEPARSAAPATAPAASAAPAAEPAASAAPETPPPPPPPAERRPPQKAAPKKAPPKTKPPASTSPAADIYE
jgi:hypothetical protein